MPLIKSKPAWSVRALSTAGLKVDALSPNIQTFIEEQAKICQPNNIHVCDGSEAENKELLDTLLKNGRLQRLPKYDNW